MSRPFASTPVAAVKVGDKLTFGDPYQIITVERITTAEYDGWTGLHGTSTTFSSKTPWFGYYKPTDTIRVLTPSN